MALLQIAEPGQATEPHRRKVAVGIDLGTTHSLVAGVRSGSAEVLADETGEVLLPSAVRYGRDGVMAVGAKAYAEAGSDPTNTIVSVKRLMGRGLLDAKAQGTPYELVANGEGGMVGLHTVAGEISPVQVSAEILRVLKERAQAHFGLGIADQLDGAVITVPAYFDDAQRQATKDAARLAGLPVLRLINEPTAAALAYGLDHGAEGAYAIFDLGGGTFDISILRLTRGIFEVMATGGNTNLGGDDFDRLLADEWLSQWGCLRPSLSAKENRRLALLARKLKEELTHQADDHAELSAAWEDDDGKGHVARITRERFNGITADLVKETLRMSHRVLEDANLSVKDLNGVVLVGGATRMPCIRAAVKEFFQQDPKVDLDPDRVVAIGAALQANLLVGNRQADDDWLLLDVLPLSLGIETMGGLTERIIPRNTAIPVARAQEFTTFKDGQTAMSIHVVQGEREVVSECRSLAQFELRGIPPMVAGRARIAVTFQVDADGLLSVTARESTTGAQSSVMVKPSYGLTDAQIADMLTDAFSSAKEDMTVRCLREAQVDAQRLLEALSSALREDGDLLSREERTAVDEAMELLRTTCGSKELELLQDRTKALGLLTDDFAARRMDRAVARALSGKSIHNVAG